MLTTDTFVVIVWSNYEGQIRTGEAFWEAGKVNSTDQERQA
jgi:hypothetical protein